MRSMEFGVAAFWRLDRRGWIGRGKEFGPGDSGNILHQVMASGRTVSNVFTGRAGGSSWSTTPLRIQAARAKLIHLPGPHIRDRVWVYRWEGVFCGIDTIFLHEAESLLVGREVTRRPGGTSSIFQSMKQSLKLCLLALAAVPLASCTPGERGALIGGALGAGTGALIGDETGALVGGAIGAIAGSEISKNRAARNQYYYNQGGYGYGAPPPPPPVYGGYHGGYRGY